MRKARPDATLKTLPPAIQAELWDLLQRTRLDDAVALVRERWQVKTSASALSNFFSWHPRSRVLERAATVTDEVVSKLKGAGIDLDDDTASRAGQAFFETLALQDGNADLFLDLRRLRQKDREHHLTERRVALLEQKAALADKAKGVVDDQTLTEEQKAARLREIFRM